MPYKADLDKLLNELIELIQGEVYSSFSINYAFRLLLLKSWSDLINNGSSSKSELPFNLPEDFNWEQLKDCRDGLKEELYDLGKHIESSNPSLKGIFSNPDYNNWKQISDSTLKTLVQKLTTVNLHPSNLATPSILEDVVQDKIDQIAQNESQQGRYITTPSSIRELLVHLVKPEKGMSVGDPACGVGGLLAKCARFVNNHNPKGQCLQLYGQEMERPVWELATLNLLLQNIYPTALCLGDTLDDPKLVKDGQLLQFDRIVSNPSFGLGKRERKVSYAEDDSRFRFGIPPKNWGDYAFIQHILATLNERGIAAIVQSSSVLHRSATGRNTNVSEQEIRKGIIKEDRIEAVVVLASGLLHISSVTPVILIFNQQKPESRRQKILFVDASQDYEEFKGKRVLKSEHITRIVEAYNSFAEQASYAKAVPLEEIAEKSYDLSIHHYIKPDEGLLNLDLELYQLRDKLRRLEEENTAIEQKFSNSLEQMGIFTD